MFAKPAKAHRDAATRLIRSMGSEVRCYRTLSDPATTRAKWTRRTTPVLAPAMRICSKAGRSSRLAPNNLPALPNRDLAGRSLLLSSVAHLQKRRVSTKHSNPSSGPADTMTINAASAPYKALVLGGSYGGLSAALNLIDLCDARPARCGRGDEPPAAEKISVDVTIVDERDGFCKSDKYRHLGRMLTLSLRSLNWFSTGICF